MIWIYCFVSVYGNFYYRRIKKLQDEIRHTQASTLAAEEEYTQLAYNDYRTQQEVRQINQQMYNESLKCQELEAAIREAIQSNQSRSPKTTP